MKCPHCLVDFHPPWSTDHFRWNSGSGGALLEGGVAWKYLITEGPACERAVIYITRPGHSQIMVYPQGMARAPLPPEVPERFAVDYREACLVLADSPKASAALSRYCLQNLLREVAKVKPSDLSKE